MTKTVQRFGVVSVAMILMTSGFLGVQWLFPVYMTYRNSGLQDTIATLSRQYRGDLATDSHDIHDRATSYYMSDTQSLLATVYKLYVAYAVYTLADTGQLSLSGTLAGMSYSLDEYLDLVQSVSDKERDTIPSDGYERIDQGDAITR